VAKAWLREDMAQFIFGLAYPHGKVVAIEPRDFYLSIVINA
jgi:hypothetical protein